MVTQQRRLAEFATILGDFKLAVNVWESLRKESKGGSVSVLLYYLCQTNRHYATPLTRIFYLSYYHLLQYILSMLLQQ